MKKKKIINWIAEFRIRVGRGVGIIYDFRQAMIIGAAAQIILKLTILQAIITTFVAYVAFFIIGSLKVVIDLFKREAELQSSKYNPHLNQLTRLTEKLK